MRIWVVGDDAPERARLAAQLESAFADAEVQACGTQGREAHACAAQDAPDLVLLCGAVEVGRLSRGVPAVWVVDAAEEAAAAEAMAEGVISDYVLRDHPARLLPAVRNSLERARLAARCAALERQASPPASAAPHARLASVLQQIPSGVVVVDAATGRVLLTNPQVERIWGQSLDHVEGMGQYAAYRGYDADGRLIDPDRWPVVRAMRTGEVVTDEEITIERADGTRRIIQVSAAPLRDAGGRIESAVAVFYDVTARRAAEEALRSSEMRYRRLFLDHRSAMLLIDPASGQITDANPAAADFYGHTPEVLTTMRITELNVLSSPEVFGEMARAVKERGLFEFRHRLASGEIREVEVFTSPIDFDGYVLLHSIIHDVTGRRRARDELRYAHDQLNAVFRSITDAVMVFDVHGEPVRANPAAQAILGYDPSTERSDQPTRHVTIRWADGRETPRHERPSRRALRGETVIDEELRVVDAQGRERWIVASAAPLRHEGRKLGAVLVWHDVTEQRRLSAEARRRAAELDALFESIQAGVLFYDPDGSLLRANRRAVEMLGYRNGQHLLPLSDRLVMLDMRTVQGEPFPAEELPAVRVLRGEPPASSLVKFRLPPAGDSGTDRSDGGDVPWTWAMIHAGPILGAEGQIRGAATVMMDVTAQQALLEQVAQQAAELRATVKAMPDGVLIYGPAGEIREMNDSARRILGYTAEDQDRPLDERVRLLEVETREGRPHPAREVPVVRALRGEVVRSEVLAIWRGSERVWISASAAPIHTEDGTVLGAVATFSDVTPLFVIQEALEEANAELEVNALELQEQSLELHQQAERLGKQNLELARLAELAAAEEARLAAILDALPQGVIIADAQGRLVDMNDRVYELWGQDAPRASSSDEYGVYRGWWAESGEPLEAEDWALARALRHGETSMAEVIDIERFDGEEATILNSAAPIFDRQGQITGAVAITQDITAWRAAEEELAVRTQELEVLNRVNRRLVGTLEMDEVLGAVLRELCELFEGHTAVAWLAGQRPASMEADHERGLLCRCMDAGAGRPTDPRPIPADAAWLDHGQGLAGWVMEHGHSDAISDAPTNPRYYAVVDDWLGIEVQSVVAIPLKVQSEVIGVLEVYDRRRRGFDAQQVTLAESIAAVTAVAVERAQLYAQARRDAEVRAVLLNEVNHRVKNNLSAILGLVSAERRRPGIREDVTCRAVLDDLSNRVYSLVAAHAMLSAGGWAELKLTSLVDRVAASSVTVMEGEGAPGRNGARVEVTPSPVTVSAQQAHHLALVINELVTNTAKYGHSGDGVAIAVGIDEHGEEIHLTFRDRGPGYPCEVLQGEGRSVGLKLVDAIVSLSLRGWWTLYNDGGAITEIHFPAHQKLTIEESDETKA